jgi:hypothetical protein
LVRLRRSKLSKRSGGMDSVSDSSFTRYRTQYPVTRFLVGYCVSKRSHVPGPSNQGTPDRLVTRRIRAGLPGYEVTANPRATRGYTTRNERVTKIQSHSVTKQRIARLPGSLLRIVTRRMDCVTKYPAIVCFATRNRVTNARVSNRVNDRGIPPLSAGNSSEPNCLAAKPGSK